MKTFLSRCLYSLMLAGLLLTLGTQASATSFAILLGGADVSDGCHEVSIEVPIAEAKGPLYGFERGNKGFKDGEASNAKRTRPGLPARGTIELHREYVNKDMTFRNWRDEIQSACGIERRSMTIKFITDDHTAELRSYNFFDCFPEAIEPDPSSTNGTAPTETVTISFGEIEFLSPPAAGNRQAGIVSAVFDQQGQLESWDAWAGGEPALVLSPLFQGVKSHADTSAPLILTKLALISSAANPRPALFQWINDVVSGKSARKTLTVSELRPNGTPGRAFSYTNTFPVSYGIDGFDSKSSGHIREYIECVAETIKYN